MTTITARTADLSRGGMVARQRFADARSSNPRNLSVGSARDLPTFDGLRDDFFPRRVHSKDSPAEKTSYKLQRGPSTAGGFRWALARGKCLIGQHKPRLAKKMGLTGRFLKRRIAGMRPV